MEIESLKLACYFVNATAITLIGVLVASNWWRLKDNTWENKCLFSMLGLTFLGGVLDSVCCTFEGTPGNFARIMAFSANSLLYIVYMLLSLFWFLFLVEHMKFRLKFVHKAILGGLVAFGVFVVILNLFIPVAFTLTGENNVYERLLGYYLYLFIDHGFVVDSLCLYLIARKRGGLMKLFPVWIYVFPFVLGTVVQSLALGITVLPISFAVSIAGVLACVQGFVIYKDPLTGVKNKVYLDYVANRYSKVRNKNLVGIIVNINDFRKINQERGRDVGDEVLVYLARIMSRNVGELGNVARYAADEFVAVLNVQNEMAVSLCIARIKADIQDYNRKRDCPCKIDVRIGHSELEFFKYTVNQVVDGLNRLVEKERLA